MLILRSFTALAFILLGWQVTPRDVKPKSNVTMTRNLQADTATQFFDAIARNNLAGARDAINSGVDVNARFRNGQLPLTMYSSIEVVKLLLDAGANVNIEDERGVTPLMASLEEKRPPMMCELLLKAGANVNYRNKNGETVLLHAIDSCVGSDDNFRLLLSYGANVNDQLPDGRTAVMVAARRGHCGSYKSIKMLIDAGADLNIRNKSGKTALEQYIADIKYAPGYYSHFDIPKMLKLLRGSK